VIHEAIPVPKKRRSQGAKLRFSCAPKILFDAGAIVVSIRHLLRKPDGSLYYQRRIPAALKAHYGNKNRILESLRTRSLPEAARKIKVLTKRDDSRWAMMRASLSNGEQPLAPPVVKFQAEALLEKCTAATGHPDINVDNLYDYLLTKYGDDWYSATGKGERDALMNPVEREAARLLFETPEQRKASRRLSEALAIYLETHRNQQPKFIAFTTRAISHVYASVGDLELRSYDREMARQVRDSIPGSTGTKRRRLDAIVAVFNAGLHEFNLILPNPFARLNIRNEGHDATVRVPFTSAELQAISEACLARDDDLRWLIALQMDTGARLGELVGLRRDDVLLDGPIPFVQIREHPALGRTLKTPNSRRKVPLVGMALWGAERALNAPQRARLNGSGASERAKPATLGWLFPRYAADGNIRATAASASLNKWLTRLTGTSKTTHCFRHAMKDLLRAALVPDDIQKQLLGHGSRSVSDGYGQGYPLEHLQEALR
jgi:integrase